ncbi:hypothetical protein CBR_g46001 [Chara braunii]|uniref:C-terminal of Roc (COR) domain-containing protein n=1 Tax=Chara braunii TaxID=69332 RepID=A0A388LZZ5_CHABU|nr:hypothetical protein CBR_g46001 [Chara braunii]|eukprot:GBG87845.1 hypothetical protein CBR_g46001 [Chara braunii]
MLTHNRSLTHFMALFCELDSIGMVNLIEGVTRSVSLQECDLWGTMLLTQAVERLADGLALPNKLQRGREEEQGAAEGKGTKMQQKGRETPEMAAPNSEHWGLVVTGRGKRTWNIGYAAATARPWTPSRGDSTSILGTRSWMPSRGEATGVLGTRLQKLTLTLPSMHDDDSSCGKGESIVKALARLLSMNDSLKELRVRSPVPAGAIIRILEGLKRNNCLEIFDCLERDRPLSESEITHILSILDSNMTIRSLGSFGSGNVRINRKLKRNYWERSILQVTGAVEYTPGRHIRCFLAGEPFAGKTALKKSITQSKLDSLVEKVSGWVLPTKAKGVRIANVTQRHCDEGTATNIQFWDLGGEQQYKSIHDFFMPTLGNEMAVLPMFLLVCNPVRVRDGTMSKAAKGKSVEWRSIPELKMQLKYWLRLIAANSGAMRKPLVALVFNPHHPLPSPCEFTSQAKELLEWASVKFQDMLEIGNVLFVVDARERADCRPVRDFLFRRAKAILKGTKMLRVMDQVLSKIVSLPRHFPLLSWEDFSRICQSAAFPSRYRKEEPLLCEDGEPVAEQHLSKAATRYLADLASIVARYLHDIGEVIWFDPMCFVVVKPQWFCCRIAGELIPSAFQRFGIRNGIASLQLLEHILSRSLPVLYNHWHKVEVKDLINLMVKMEMGYKVFQDGEMSVLIPACLRDRRVCGDIKWEAGRMESSGFCGFRIECKDKDRTMLTPGFFHRLQVRLHDQLKSHGVQYIIEKDLSHILVNQLGMEVFLEFSGIHDDWIDVMVRCSDDGLEHGRDWVDVNILREINDLCRDPVGLPGVELIVKVMRPECVEHLVAREHRNEFQVVDEDKLLDGMLQFGVDYEHKWPDLNQGPAFRVLSKSTSGALDLIRPSVLKDSILRQREALRRLAKGFELQRPSHHRDGQHKLTLTTTSRSVNNRPQGINKQMEARTDNKILPMKVASDLDEDDVSGSRSLDELAEDNNKLDTSNLKAADEDERLGFRWSDAFAGEAAVEGDHGEWAKRSSESKSVPGSGSLAAGTSEEEEEEQCHMEEEGGATRCRSSDLVGGPLLVHTTVPSSRQEPEPGCSKKRSGERRLLAPGS